MNASRDRTVQPRIGRWLCAVSLALALVLSLPAPAAAGAVYGRVTLNGQPLANTEITITNQDTGATVRLRTDKDGYYSVVLAPGFYLLRAGGREKTIRSYLSRAQQDVHFE